jgi:uncharacterized protein YdhG (YjbR/CyaY superfamily)
MLVTVFLLGGMDSLESAETDVDVRLEGVVRRLGLDRKSLSRTRRHFSYESVVAARLEYRREVRRDLFKSARLTLRALMPQIMPTKVQPKVNGILEKAKAEPMTPEEHVLLRLAVRARTRRVMMIGLHETADRFAAKAAMDNRLVAAFLAKRIRNSLPKDRTAAFDAALGKAGITGDASGYIKGVKEAMEKRIAAYEPDLKGIVDSRKGAILVSRKDVGLLREDDLGAGIVEILEPLLEKIGLEKDDRRRLLSPKGIDRIRASYLLTSRDGIFDAARLALSSEMQGIMPRKVSPKVREIRMRTKAGPPTAAERVRIQLAMFKRTRKIMMKELHAIADRLAVEAVRDDVLMARMLANTVRGMPGMDERKMKILDEGLGKAGVPVDDSAYKERARQAIRKAMNAYDPDIGGIVDSSTGNIIVKDEDL